MRRNRDSVTYHNDSHHLLAPDDEKYLFKPTLTVEKCREFARENAKDIIACGFNPEKTFIFNNFDHVGGEFYHNVVKISRCITTNQSKATFGFKDT